MLKLYYGYGTIILAILEAPTVAHSRGPLARATETEGASKRQTSPPGALWAESDG